MLVDTFHAITESIFQQHYGAKGENFEEKRRSLLLPKGSGVFVKSHTRDGGKTHVDAHIRGNPVH